MNVLPAILRVVTLLAGGLFLLPAAAASARLDVASGLSALAAAIVGVTLWKPVDGLAILAGLLPLATPLGLLIAAPLGGARTAEFLVLAFLGAASLRMGLNRSPSGGSLAVPILANIGVVVSAVAVGLVGEQLGTEMPLPFWRSVGDHVLTGYFADTHAFRSLHTGLIWIEGLALALIVERIVAAEPASARRVTHLLLVGAAGAAAFTVNRIMEIFLRNGASVQAAASVLSRVRIGIHWADINAVASFYALAFVPAAWLAWRLRRAWLYAAAALLFIGVWFAASRAATVAAIASFLCVPLLSLRLSKRSAVLGVGAAAVLVLAASAWSSARGVPNESAFRIRVDMARVAIDLAREHPAFGVGLGRFQEASIPWITPELDRLLPAAGGGENAHNNFLQILAEEGVVGAVSFAWLLSALIVACARALTSGHAHVELVGLAGGLAAFLVSCLAGHPLLTPQAVWLFLLAVGLAGGLAASVSPAASPRWQRHACLAFLVFLIVSVPVRIAAQERSARLQRVVLGASAIAGRIDGVDYRVAQRHSVWFVAATSETIALPLRLDAASDEPCEVMVSLDGKPADKVVPRADAWLNLRYTVSPAPTRGSRRIDLYTPVACRLLVGPIGTRP